MKLTSLTLLLLFQVYLVASVPACKNLLNVFCQFSGYCMNFNQVDLTLNGQTFSLNNYDVIGFGSVNIAANGGVGGRVATRNDFTAGAGVTIGSGIVSGGTSPTDVPVPFSLIVGRNALWTSGALFPDGSLGPVENIFVGGTFTAPPNLSARRTGGPCNLCLDAPFMAAQSFYDSISKKMATYLPNTQASISGTTLSITCNNPRDAIYFVALDESINNVAAFGAISNCNPSALWIFNIGGSSDIILRPNFDFGAIIINVLHGSGPTRNVFLAGTSTALVLAPLATVTQQSGIWTGEIIAIDINLNVLLHRGCSVIKAVTSGAAFTTGNPTVFPPPVTGFTTGFGFTTGRHTSGFAFTTGNPTVFPPPVTGFTTGFAFTTGRFTSGFSFTTGNPTVNPPPITGFTTGLLTTAEVKKCDKKDYYDCKKGDDHCNKDYDRCRKNDDDCNKKWKDDCKKEQKTTGIITSGFTTGGITVQPPPPPPTAGVTTGIIIGKTCPFWQTPCAGFAFTADGFTLSFTDFDVVSFGGIQGRTNGAIQGRVISRNDIIFGNNFVVGSNVASGLPYSLVGGRSVTWPSGALFPTTAGMWVGGNFVGGPDLIARITGGPCPGCLDPNFDAALGCYVSIQQSLLSLTPNVDWDLRYSGLELACQSYYQDLYVVQINAEDFSRVLWYMMLNCNPNARWVINILGSDDVVFYGGSFPANPRNVVYNIVGAGRTVIIHDALVLGSILAPLNIVNEASGIVVGKIIAGDIVYLTQVNTIACYTKDGAAIEGESDPWDYKSTAGGMFGSKLLLSTCIFALTYLQRRIRN